MRRGIIVLAGIAVVGLAARLLMSANGGGTILSTETAFDPEVTVVETTTISSGGSPTDWHGRASIKRREDGVLVLAYYRAQAHDTNAGALHIRFSDDNGATWTAEDETLAAAAVTGFPMNPPGSGGGVDAGEPWLYLAPNGDLLIHMWKVNYGSSLAGTYQSRSEDGGESWDTPAGPIQFTGLTTDQNDRTFATDDDFVLGDTIYAGARVYVDADGVPSASVLVTSDDNGATWTRQSTIVSSAHPSQGGQEVGLEYLGGDQIIAMIRDNPHTHSYKKVADDLGSTDADWGELIDVTGDVGIAGRQRVYTIAHLQGEAEWWDDPRLIMVGFVHQSSGSSHPRRNAVWLSPNRGEDWSGPHYIDESTEDAGYGDIFWDDDEEQFVVVSYHGSLAAASLKQYRLSISGL